MEDCPRMSRSDTSGQDNTQGSRSLFKLPSTFSHQRGRCGHHCTGFNFLLKPLSKDCTERDLETLSPRTCNTLGPLHFNGSSETSKSVWMLPWPLRAFGPLDSEALCFQGHLLTELADTDKQCVCLRPQSPRT